MYLTQKPVVRTLLFACILLMLSACGGGASSLNDSQSISGSVKTTAFKKIEAFARDSNNPAPTVQDYIDAGVSGVTTDNLAQLNSVIRNKSPADIDSTEELKALTEQLAVNIAPVADAGGNQTVQVNRNITLSGSGTDADGTIVGYSWEKDGVIVAKTASFIYSPTSAGTNTFTLTVTDDDGDTASDSINVVVSEAQTPPPSIPTTSTPPANKAPIVNAGIDLSAQVNQTITITGSGSDIDGTVTFVWKKGNTVLANSASFNYTPTVIGRNTLTLYATDNDGVTVSDSMNVTVSAVPDTIRPVITLLGNSQVNIIQGTSYSEAGATALDNKDGDISSKIQIGGETVKPDSPVNTRFIITYNVSDDAGNAAAQVTRTVTIVEKEDTIDPVITLIGATTVEVIQGSTYVEAGATATDNKDGNITANIVIAGDTVNTQASPGSTFTITYNVADKAGNPAIEVTRTVSIIADPNSAHVIPPISAADITAYLTLINNARATARTCGGVNYPAVPALSWSDKLYRASYEHSQDMSSSQVFSHEGSGTASDWTGVAISANHKSSVGERLATYSYIWSAYGENIAFGYSTAEAVMQGWLNSPGHCANIMSPNFNQAGMARLGNYWTQDFGYSN